ncbi:MAG: hypothetical protein J6Y82_07865 [Bacteroidales bacterium]|nr:hypothetical protein [Bacteroidales bacterium]
MRKSILYIAICAILIGIVSCKLHRLTEDEAKESVINGEQDRLPLITQKMTDVESITIDSMSIHVADEPMSGFLYTTWKYSVTTSYYPKKVKKVEKSIIIPVDKIRQSNEHFGYIEWETDWGEGLRVVLQDQFK